GFAMQFVNTCGAHTVYSCWSWEHNWGRDIIAELGQLGEPQVSSSSDRLQASFVPTKAGSSAGEKVTSLFLYRTSKKRRVPMEMCSTCNSVLQLLTHSHPSIGCLSRKEWQSRLYILIGLSRTHKSNGFIGPLKTSCSMKVNRTHFLTCFLHCHWGYGNQRWAVHMPFILNFPSYNFLL
uniref:Uncharacterized protein n=1 Tax=Scleropages formosus TaxID=113540 RepID=A0A8C9SDU9_SCLFO